MTTDPYWDMPKGKDTSQKHAASTGSLETYRSASKKIFNLEVSSANHDLRALLTPTVATPPITAPNPLVTTSSRLLALPLSPFPSREQITSRKKLETKMEAEQFL